MKTLRIFSDNADFQKLEVLKSNRNKRYRYGEFFVEGVRNINTAVQNGWRFSSLLYADGAPLSDWAKNLLSTLDTDQNLLLSPSLMARLSGKEDTSELLAVVKMRDDDPARIALSDNPLLTLLDRPSNKGNLGTILRSCDSLGLDGLLMTGHAVDLYDPDVVSASMGSFFNVPAVRIADNDALSRYIAALRARFPAFQLVGTTAHRETPITRVDFTRPTVLLIGNETDGLNYNLKGMCDVLATIPMSSRSSASSFNIACAATVMFYEAVRQRGE